MSSKYTSYKELMKQRQQAVQDSAGKGASTLNIPGDVLWKPKNEDSTHALSFLPYEITGKFHPDNVLFTKPLEKGEIWHRRPYGIHYNLATTDKGVLCPQETFGLPCPVCEKVNELKKDYDANKVLIKGLKVRKRCLYNVMVDDAPKVRVYDTSMFGFSDWLDKIMKSNRKKEKLLTFFMPEGGAVAYVTYVSTPGDDGQKWAKPSSVEFEERDTLPDSIVDQCVKLDEVFRVVPYAQIQAMMNGDDVGEEVHEPDAAPVREMVHVSTTQDVEPEDTEEPPPPPPPPPTPKKRKVAPPVVQKEEPPEIPMDFEEEEKANPPPPPPAPKAKAKAEKASKAPEPPPEPKKEKEDDGGWGDDWIAEDEPGEDEE